MTNIPLMKDAEKAHNPSSRKLGRATLKISTSIYGRNLKYFIDNGIFVLPDKYKYTKTIKGITEDKTVAYDAPLTPKFKLNIKIDQYRNKSMKDSMKTNEDKYDEEMYELIDDNDFNYCAKTILKQAIEHPETAYKQVQKLKKCLEELEKSGKNTVNYTDPEARKSPNKEQVMQTGYNEQIAVDNKNGLIIAVDVTQDANDQKLLIPMIKMTQQNIQQALNLTNEQTDQIMHNMDILADYGYYTNKTVYKNHTEEKYSVIMPNKQQASHQKDSLRRKSQQITNNNKKDGFSKHNMIYDEENHCYICPENKKLPVQQVYPGIQ